MNRASSSPIPLLASVASLRARRALITLARAEAFARWPGRTRYGQTAPSARPAGPPRSGLPRALIAIALASSACAGGGAMPCRVGADCESGVCFADGRCAPLDAGADAGIVIDASTSDDGAAADADATDARADAGRDAGIDAGPIGCGDGDGRITAAELPLPIGEWIGLRVAFDVAVETHGVDRADGTRLWDLEGPYEGDEDRSYVRRGLGGEWFEAAFPGATYTLPLSAESDLRGVFERTSDAVLLRGVVSPSGGLSRTELEYDPPITVWRLPLEVGASWEETSTITGVTSGVASFYTERWQVSVDARGQLGTPAGVRSVLRVSTLITRTAGVVTTHRRLAFLEECEGTVAQVFGADGDARAEPTFAAEVWRVAP